MWRSFYSRGLHPNGEATTANEVAVAVVDRAVMVVFWNAKAVMGFAWFHYDATATGQRMTSAER